MKPIKFRAWANASKVMFYPDSQDGWELQNGELVELPNTILMQYTGLKDKNGKEIYEGDIVEWDDGSDGKWRRRCEVGWEKAHYTLIGYWYDVSSPIEKHPVDFKFGAFIYEKDGELEVIGNIYEHPSLLTKSPQG